MGALLNHITGGADPETFQPMNVNFGLFPPLDTALPAKSGAAERKAAHSRRALEAIDLWLGARAAAE
jgi:methylenetetrahydrofolate--tRNA-(uracil-5-)-methyltransferase